MGDSFITIVAIVLVAILMFIFPLMAISEQSDIIAQSSVQKLTADFVDEVRTTGKITAEDYSKYEESLAATGNSYEVEMELQILDENVGVKTAQADLTKIGENQYYTKYTTQILQELGVGTSAVGEELKLKEGDIITKIDDITINKMSELRSYIYTKKVGDTVNLTVLRKNREYNIQITLRKKS